MPPDSLIDPAVEVARLTRRLERERASRQEAESISERGLRELYAKQQQLEFLAKIALAANQTSSVADILQFAVVQVCANVSPNDRDELSDPLDEMLLPFKSIFAVIGSVFQDFWTRSGAADASSEPKVWTPDQLSRHSRNTSSVWKDLVSIP